MLVGELPEDDSEKRFEDTSDPKVLMVRGRQHKSILSVEAIKRIGSYGKAVLRARGNSIPDAISVANIVTLKMLKGSSKTESVMVDSIYPPGGRPTSTIEIVLVKV